MKNIKNKNFIKTSFFLASFVAIFILVGVMKTKAGLLDNVTGWLWDGTDKDNVSLSGDETGVGWISTNSTNCDSNGDGKSEGATGCPAIGTAMAQYGLNLPQSGSVSGYAWSENVGWVSFNAADVAGCPAPDPTYGCGAQSHGNNYLTGWARIISLCDNNGSGTCTAGETNANAGGWNGWVKLSGIVNNGSSTPYGITVNATTHALMGYAWSVNSDGSPEFGWIEFNPANGGATASIPSVSLAASPSQLIILSQGQKLSDLSTAAKTVNLSWTTTGIVVSCTASCKSGACDSTWTGSLALSPSASMNKNIVAQGQDAVYQINCKDGAGNDIAPATQEISVGCYANTCQANTCSSAGSSFIPAIDNATCTSIPPSTCSSNSDCIQRSSGNWKEIAP